MKSNRFPLTKILSCTICQIAVYGWVSGKEGREKGTKSTSFFVKQMLNRSTTGLEHQAQLIRDAKSLDVDLFNPEFNEAITQIIKWAKSIPMGSAPHGDTFDGVIKALAYTGDVDSRYVGHAVAMPKAYERSLAPRINNSKHYGTLKDRIDVVVKDIKIAADKESVAPRWWLITGKTEDGSLLKWFDNINPVNSSSSGFLDGDTIKIRGTIKSHEEWKGYRSTKLNRVVILEVNGALTKAPKLDPADRVIRGGPAASSSDDNLPF